MKDNINKQIEAERLVKELIDTLNIDNVDYKKVSEYFINNTDYVKAANSWGIDLEETIDFPYNNNFGEVVDFPYDNDFLGRNEKLNN